ncbi:MAG: site-specific integrase [Acidobacteriota bacterium]|nr:site-specific integrase [Acidobacteriota bacterium]
MSSPKSPAVPVAREPANLHRIAELRQDFHDFKYRADNVLRYSETSVAWFVSGFRNFERFLEAGAQLPPETFRYRMFALDQWIAWNTERGISRLTMNNYWRSVRTFFKDRAEQTRAASPFEGQKAPKAPTPLPRAKSPNECAAILHAARNYPWRTAMQRQLAVATIGTMLYAGLRKSELFRLVNGDVDLELGTIRIERGKGRYGGKKRIAFIPPDLARILRAYLVARDDAKLHETPYFFVTAIRGHQFSEGALRDIVRRVSRASGVRFSPHVLRHSFVTQLIRSNVPLAVVRDLAGHANIETTLGYTGLVDEDRQREIRKLRYP